MNNNASLNFLRSNSPLPARLGAERKRTSKGAGQGLLSFIKLLIMSAVITILGACSNAPDWKLRDVSLLVPSLSFTLTRDTGKTVTADDFRGKIVLLFFGYTHCPDVCPTTLTQLSGIVNSLGEKADQVQILFVSVDPERDSVAGLKEYAAAFSPHIVGLRPSTEELTSLAKKYRVSYTPFAADGQGNYEVSHSSGVFIFDRQGKARLVAIASDPAESILADLKKLIDEK